MQDSYVTPSEKMGLVCAAMKQAMEYAVAEFGIGESIALSLFGWTGGKLTCVAQLDVGFDETHTTENHVRRTLEAAMIIRRGWGVDSFTLAAEGYVSNDPDFSRGRPLAEAFLQDDGSKVSECLTLLHVDNAAPRIVAVPYQTKGRTKIVWGDIMVTEEPTHIRDNAFLKALSYALLADIMEPPTDIETFHLALSMGLEQSAGFFLNYSL
jgi:hypothetical protein